MTKRVEPYDPTSDQSPETWELHGYVYGRERGGSGFHNMVVSGHEFAWKREAWLRGITRAGKEAYERGDRLENHVDRFTDINERVAFRQGYPDEVLLSGRQVLDKAPEKKGIGDMSSKEKGTAARYNDGKVKLQYMPMRLLLNMNKSLKDGWLYGAGLLLAQFEEGRDEAVNELLTAIDLANTCEVFDFGAKKYAAWSWAKGFPWSTVLASAKRHWLAMANGKDTDPESGLPHAGHFSCNVVFLAHFLTYYREGDDRPDPYLFKTTTG